MRQTTRQSVLDTLQERGSATVNDLADAVGLKPISVRHHLNTLLAEGLVQIEQQRQGVGRPRHLYRLTEAGHSQLPQKYHLLAGRLLDHLKGALPPETVEGFLRDLGAQVGEGVRAEIVGLPIDEQLQHLVEALSLEGFMAQWERDGDVIRLTEHHCPYSLVVQHHPEICTFDQTIIQIALETEVVRSTCMLDGDHVCTFEMSALS